MRTGSDILLGLEINGSSEMEVYSVSEGGDVDDSGAYEAIEKKWGNRHCVRYLESGYGACFILQWIHRKFGARYMIRVDKPVFRPNRMTGVAEEVDVLSVLDYLAYCFDGQIAFVYNDEVVAILNNARDAYDFVVKLGKRNEKRS